MFTRNYTEVPEIAVVAAAGPVREHRVALTNAKQRLDGAALPQATGAGVACHINDFAAAAWPTLVVKPNGPRVLSAPPELSPSSGVVIGPGAGLGVAALVKSGDIIHFQSGEGEHFGIGPRNAFETEALQALRAQWPEVFFGETPIMDAEGPLSGTGLQLVYKATWMAEEKRGDPLQPVGIFERARAASDPIAAKTVDIFKAHFAQLAGDFGLVFGADGALAKITVRAFKVVMLPIFFDADLGFAQRAEDLPVQKFITKPGIQAFATSIFPGRSWRDVGGLVADRRNPFPDQPEQ